MDTLDTFDSPAACQAHLLNCVNQAMEDAIHANEETKKSNEGIVSRVNHLNEAIHNLEEELEHKVSVDELSAYLEMPAAEIETYCVCPAIRSRLKKLKRIGKIAVKVLKYAGKGIFISEESVLQ